MNYEAPDVLRIIARDALLSGPDRNALRLAAEELDRSHEQLMRGVEELTAMRAHYRAMQERLTELTPWLMTTGSARVTARFAK